MKFAMSYSCGKDSTLALHKMLAQGDEAICLIICFNEAAGRSYFHGADKIMLQAYAEALGLPLLLCPTDGMDYAQAFEAGLLQAKAMGAEAACFGDIDIAENRRWEEARCRVARLAACFPLWQQGRETLVQEVIALGYRCLIKSLNYRLLPLSLLGRCLDEPALAEIKAAGVDVCGENGEYHTLALGGPIFRQPLPVVLGEVMANGDYAFVDVRLDEELLGKIY